MYTNKVDHFSKRARYLLGILIALVLTLGVSAGIGRSIATAAVLPDNQLESKSQVVMGIVTPEPTTERYRITIKNYFPWDIYVFLNGHFLRKVAPETTSYYSTVKEGTYTLKYCFDRQGEACEMTRTVIVGRKTVISIGKLPTPRPGVSSVSDTESVSAYRLKINNRSSFWVQVFIDGKYFFYIPSHKFITYRPISPGTHVFRFCVADRYCWKDRRVEVSGDTELFLGP